jgi:hypothetical protein
LPQPPRRVTRSGEPSPKLHGTVARPAGPALRAGRVLMGAPGGLLVGTTPSSGRRTRHTESQASAHSGGQRRAGARLRQACLKATTVGLRSTAPALLNIRSGAGGYPTRRWICPEHGAEQWQPDHSRDPGQVHQRDSAALLGPRLRRLRYRLTADVHPMSECHPPRGGGWHSSGKVDPDGDWNSMRAARRAPERPVIGRRTSNKGARHGG